MTIKSIASITFDCPDADALAKFWGELLGLEEAYAAEDRSNICLAWGETMISFVASPSYVAPVWPSQPAHVHLDLYCDDLDEAVARAKQIGATEPRQPNPEGWRVLLDPAGHAFCFMLPFE